MVNIGRPPLLSRYMNDQVKPQTETVIQPPDQPTMVWDGDCTFCRKWIERWARLTGGTVLYQQYQKTGDRFAPLNAADFRRAVCLIEPDGRVSRAAEAVYRSLYLAGSLPLFYRLYRTIPLFATVSEVIYRWVARNRDRLVRWGL